MRVSRECNNCLPGSGVGRSGAAAAPTAAGCALVSAKQNRGLSRAVEARECRAVFTPIEGRSGSRVSSRAAGMRAHHTQVRTGARPAGRVQRGQAKSPCSRQQHKTRRAPLNRLITLPSNCHRVRCGPASRSSATSLALGHRAKCHLHLSLATSSSSHGSPPRPPRRGDCSVSDLGLRPE